MPEQPDPNVPWHFTAPGVGAKIREIAKEYNVDILDISSSHSNLPATFYVSSSLGVGVLNIRSTDAEGAESEIRAHFDGVATDSADVTLIEETKPENLPEDKGDTVVPTIQVVQDVPATTRTPSDVTSKHNPKVTNRDK